VTARELFVLAATALVLLLAAGCGKTAFENHYQAMTLTAGGFSVAGVAVDAARSEALDRVEAQHVTRGPGRVAALEAEAAHWRPIGAALDGARSGLLAWAASVSLARAADEDEDLLPSLVEVLRRIVGLYSDAVRLAASLSPPVELPALPGIITSLLGD
jgi:hypothetical protein